MSTLSPPKPSAPARRRTVPGLSRNPETRSVQIGILGTVLVHVLLFLLAPLLLKIEPKPLARPADTSRQFSIELSPEMFEKPKPTPPPDRFVETNPDAPENEPDQTRNFAARNQQVAQEKPTPDGKNDMPALEGRTDVQSTQIVDGRLVKPDVPVESAPPVVAPPTETNAPTAPKLEQNPLMGFDNKQGDNLTGIGSNIGKLPDPKPADQKVEGAKNVPLIQGATSSEPLIDPQRPRPRPMIVKQQQVRPAIFTENKIGTSNIGPIAVDARWSNYGAYLQRMMETVQIQWERILYESKVYPVSGSTVEVKFIMNSEGAITRVVNVESTATDAASRACMSAITDRSPYGKWTDDMVAVLGDQQEMTFKFFYQ